MNTNSREKRSCEAEESSNNSFVKNVTSRMSGLLPSTITKWFSGPSSSKANGSATIVDATDSTSEDEASEVINPPAAKRLRLSSPVINHFIPTDNKYTSTNVDTIQFPLNSVYTSQNRGSILNIDSSNLMSTHSNVAEDVKIKSNESERKVSYLLKNSMSSGDSMVIRKRKSLSHRSDNMSSNRSEETSQVERNRSYYKHSLLGSPFYHGRTTYGGAASTYLNEANIQDKKTTLVKKANSSESVNVSQSARKIMDLLENFSSPLIEAKRISQFVTHGLNNKSITSDPNTKKVISYKTQELHIPSMASILRIKQRSRLMDTTSAARLLIASHSSSSKTVRYPTPPCASTNEDDNNFKTRHSRKSKIISSVSRETSPLNLPSAVLQIDQDNLPKFDFQAPVISTSSTSLPILPSNSTTNSAVNVIITPSKSNDFKIKSSQSKQMVYPKGSDFIFSSPVTVSRELISSHKNSPIFSFASPEKTVDEKKTKETNNNNKDSCVVGTTKLQEKIKPDAINANWNCNSCLVSNKPEVVICGCGSKNALQIKNLKICVSCNVAKCENTSDKCLDCNSKTSVNVNSFKVLSKPDTSQWKCEDCWVSNKANVEICVCCGGKKSTNKKEELNSPVKGWKCKICLLDNKMEADKCIACFTPKSNITTVNDTSISQKKSSQNLWGASNESFKNIVQKQTNKWECPNCLVRNDDDKCKCVCCETEKPGSIKGPEKKFNFGLPTNTFKFGIDPKKQEADIEKLKSINNTESKEKNNNVVSTSLVFGVPKTFGIPLKTTNDVPNNKTDNQDIPKSTFKFGIPNENVLKTPIINEKITTENPPEPKTMPEKALTVQEVPNIDSTLQKEMPQITLSSTLFSNQTEGTTPKCRLLAKPTDSQSKSTVSEQNEIPNKQTSASSQSINVTKTINAENSLKVNTNIFDMPKTLPSSELTFKPTNVNTPTSQPALFQKNNIPTNINFTAPPLFQKIVTPPISSTVTTTVSQNSIPQIPSTSSSSLFSKVEPQNSSIVLSTSLFTKSEVQNVSTTASLFQAPIAANSTSLSMFSSGTTKSATSSLFSNTEVTASNSAVVSQTPLFSFGGLNSASNAQKSEKPKFNFTFGNSNKVEGANLFTNSFGGSNDNSANKFCMPSTLSQSNIPAITSNSGNGLLGNSTLGGTGMSGGNNMTGGSGGNGGNGIAGGNTLAGGNGIAGGTTLPGGNGMGNSVGGNMMSSLINSNMGMQSSNAMSAASPSGLFGSSAKKETNLWPANNQSTNIFSTNSSTNITQKPAAFSFGNNMAFNSNNSSATFGGTAPQSQNVFGIANSNSSNAPTLFSTPLQQQTSTSVFGNPQPASNSTSGGLFGQHNLNTAPTFGAPTQAGSTFEGNSTSIPSFNFGSQQPINVIGLAQQQQPQQSGVYSFGGPPGAGPQFTVGSSQSATPAIRRIRKAVRRTTPR